MLQGIKIFEVILHMYLNAETQRSREEGRIMFTKLNECILFRGLTEEQLIELFSTINYKEKEYKKDEIVAHSDDECRNLLIVLEGSVKGEMVDFSGKTIKIEDIESPRALAPAFLFGRNNRYYQNGSVRETHRGGDEGFYTGT